VPVEQSHVQVHAASVLSQTSVTQAISRGRPFVIATASARHPVHPDRLVRRRVIRTVQLALDARDDALP